jgi:hypothetical protein
VAVETWEGSAEVTGYGAAVHNRYPIPGRGEDDTTGDCVEFWISKPAEIPGPLGSPMYKQTIELRVTAEASRVQELAMETVLNEASVISFATDRMVRVSLGFLRRIPSQGAEPEERTMLFVRRFKGPRALETIDAEHLKHIAEQIGDVESDRGRRIVRALRWLRRAYLADDEVEEFASLAMGYEALSSLLPRPPVKDEGRKGGKEKKRTPKVETSEVLRHWAVNGCGIAEEEWKIVGRLRHELFHGGLT